MKTYAIKRRLRNLASFCGATENEIAVDRMIFEVSGTGPSRLGFWPRPSKWIKHGRRFPLLSYCLWWVMRLVWIFGGSHIFSFYQFFSAWLRARRIDLIHNDDVLKDSGYVLALSSRVGDIVHEGHIEDLPYTWITVPWAPLARVPADAKCVDVFSLLSKSEIWHAFQDAIFATHVLHNRKRTSSWALQSYTAFRWFSVRAAVDKLIGRLFMANHFDRWAVLVDSSVQAKKNQVNTFGKIRRRELILVQHGILGNLGDNNKNCAVAKLRLRRRLQAVSQLYVYNAEAADAFKTDILSAGCVRRGLKISYYQPDIELKVDLEYSGLKILFVGHTLCEELHQYILDSLSPVCEFRAYYKPHPLAPMSNGLANLDWVIVKDVSWFPAVDLLISYPSTLVVEYSGMGVPAMVHFINLSKDDADDFINSTILKIQELQVGIKKH